MSTEDTTKPDPQPVKESPPVGKWVGGHWIVDPSWGGAK